MKLVQGQGYFPTPRTASAGLQPAQWQDLGPGYQADPASQAVPPGDPLGMAGWVPCTVRVDDPQLNLIERNENVQQQEGAAVPPVGARGAGEY